MRSEGQNDWRSGQPTLRASTRSRRLSSYLLAGQNRLLKPTNRLSSGQETKFLRVDPSFLQEKPTKPHPLEVTPRIL